MRLPELCSVLALGREVTKEKGDVSGILHSEALALGEQNEL